MDKSILYRLGCLISGLITFCNAVHANDEVPCLVISGHDSNEKQSLDLAIYNRITFGDDSMTISSSKNADADPVTLLYSAFNHMEVQDDIPMNGSDVDEVWLSSQSSLFYNRATESLGLNAELGDVYAVGIFDMDGRLMVNSRLRNGESLPTNTLSSGVYVAIAINGNTRLALKFVSE